MRLQGMVRIMYLLLQHQALPHFKGMAPVEAGVRRHQQAVHADRPTVYVVYGLKISKKNSKHKRA